MLKAVAEAASAYRTGSDVYVAASKTYPHERQVFYTYDGSTNPRAAADEFMSSISSRPDGANWVLLGPFTTPTEEPSSRAIATDFTVTIRGRDVNGNEFERIFDGEMDAIFLTLPAFDKFVMPYYTYVFGVERAREMREDVVSRELGPLGGHVWNSKFLPA